jgi:outer membrane receptor protein involved in Fe transport
MLPGFSASVDYYRIKVSDIISTLTAQQEVNFCFAGLQQYCSAFDLAPATGTAFVNVQAFNLASAETKGIDLEASYQFGLEKLHLPGSLTIRALATHVIDFTSNSGIRDAVTGQPVPALQLAGQNTGASGGLGNTPHWKVYGTQSWDFRNIGIDLTERWLSSGVFGYQYVVCQSNCPVSTVNNPTISYNHMAGALYFDLGGRYSLTDKLTAFVKVDNLFDRDPVPSPQTNTGLDINPALYDTLGRMYRAGFRFNL